MEGDQSNQPASNGNVLSFLKNRGQAQKMKQDAEAEEKKRAAEEAEL